LFELSTPESLLFSRLGPEKHHLIFKKDGERLCKVCWHVAWFSVRLRGDDLIDGVISRLFY